MNKLLKISLSVMLVMAVFCVCFGVENNANFFDAGAEILKPVEGLVSYSGRFIQNIVNEPVFSYDDEIVVTRLVFDDGHYCDVASYNSFFSKDMLMYSTNPRVVSYKSGFLRIGGTFYDSYGRVVYKQGWTQEPYVITTTYKDYIQNFKDSSSLDGWH